MLRILQSLLPLLNLLERVERSQLIHVHLADLIQQRMFGGGEQCQLNVASRTFYLLSPNLGTAFFV